MAPNYLIHKQMQFAYRDLFYSLNAGIQRRGKRASVSSVCCNDVSNEADELTNLPAHFSLLRSHVRSTASSTTAIASISISASGE
jgi:hypothetical protein